MNTDILNLGQVVESKNGRDKGHLFAVVGIIDENYVFISDGKKRKISKPKLKKIKHLDIYNHVIDEISMFVNSEKNITDSFLRAELNKLK